MAFRYRQITPQTGDFINPDDWNVNVREFTNEFNGHLDRDNLPEKCITTTSIKAEAFHKVLSKRGHGFTLEYDQSRYTEVQVLEFETQHQGILMCDWSGNWDFGIALEELEVEQFVQDFDVRITVNGTEISRIVQENNLKKSSNGYMVGAFPVEAGFVTVQVEARTFAVSTIVSATATSQDPKVVTELDPGASVTFGDIELVVVFRKA
jgi:hypothetical protein|tara:strand:+ start:3772 stop:4395 length:624 start_codon:yes stop_codon:yes gene_type:complete